MPRRASILSFVLILAVLATAALGNEERSFERVARGKGDSIPSGYAAPLVSNGSLCLLVDYRGGQSQRNYAGMTPGILWAGRRYGPPGDQLIPFGHFEHQLSVSGRAITVPVQWTQTLDTKSAVVTCRNEYGDGLAVETTVFTPLGEDLIVVRRRVTAKKLDLRQVRTTFHYCFKPPGKENRAPRRVTGNAAWNDSSRTAEFHYRADGHPSTSGVVLVFSDMPSKAVIDGQRVALESEVPLDAAGAGEVTTCLLFADTLDGNDYRDRAARRQARVRQQGFERLLGAHRKAWADYGSECYVELPDERLGQVYRTAQYHLRANATRWSFPVGLFNTHWAGRFFGWDEAFCHQALASSNHLELSRRCPEFRLAGLPKALQRASHYGKPGRYGARYPWETLEDGSEGSPPGFWMEHVFHISNIALAAWTQFLYTEDAEYLKTVGYPVVGQCARFFLANMVYETDDGRMFIGKCTDLERLGPAKERPFMTTCGAIYTLEAAAEAAGRLGKDGEEAAAWKQAAAKLRESLPHDGDRYLPYPGCTEQSIAALGGLFPYPVFDESEQRQRKAALHFVAHGRASGNMYPVGNSVCAWYAGWMAAALAAVGDRQEPFKLLSEAAAGAGCFGELFEINEAKVSMRPWFATASGNVVYALNQMLLQCRGQEIRIAAATPETWRAYAFRLACHGNLVAEVRVQDGRLRRLTLEPGNGQTEYRRTLVIPSELLDEGTLDRKVVQSVESRGANKQIAIRFKGRVEIVR